MLGPGSEISALATIRALLPTAQPNRLMLRFADQLIEAGSLVAALGT